MTNGVMVNLIGGGHALRESGILHHMQLQFMPYLLPPDVTYRDPLTYVLRIK